MRDLPSLDGRTGWLNKPLGPAELGGHVIVVNFWALTCINWVRQEPYVRAWSQSYRDDRWVVTEAGPLLGAEAEHQDYLQRYPHGYTCHFPRPDWNCHTAKTAARPFARLDARR